MGKKGALKGRNVLFSLGRVDPGPRIPYTWWVFLRCGLPARDPSLICISEQYFSLCSGLICGERREGEGKNIRLDKGVYQCHMMFSFPA